MAQTTEPLKEEEEAEDIMLPEDRSVRAVVLVAAAFSLLEQLVTKYPYLLDLKNRQIFSLSEGATDLERAITERIAWLKKKYGNIENIPEPRTIKRPTNLVTAFFIVIGVSALILYGQYNTIWRDYVVNGFYVNAPYIAVVVFLFVFLIGWAMISRRRRGRGK